MTRQRKFWAATVVLAFASVVSFFHINSYVADKNGLNGVFTVAGIVLALVAAGCLYKGVINPGSTDKH